MKIKITTTILAFCICFTSVLCYASKVEKVSSNTAQKLSDQTIKAYQTFVEDSVQLRLGYDYKNRFLSDQDKKTLQDMALNTEHQLEQIQNAQQKLLSLIENYDGDDWEQKFGETGLWKRLKKNLYSTIIFQSEVSFYKSLCLERDQQIDNSRDYLEKLELYGQSNNFYVKLIKTKYAALLDPADTTTFLNEIDRASLSGEQACIYDVEINKIRADAQLPIDVNAIKNAVEVCGQFETGIKGAFLLGRLNDMSSLKQMIQKYPQSEFFISRLTYNYLKNLVDNNQPMDKLTVFEAILAAKYVLTEQNFTQAQKTLLALNRENRFQQPEIFYATAKSIEDTYAIKAVDLYLKTSQLPSENPYKTNSATRAVELGYQLYTLNPENTAIAIKAFENYNHYCADSISPQHLYLYGKVLSDAGLTEKAKKIFNDLKKEKSDYTNFARYELLYLDIARGITNDPNKRAVVISELLDLIKSAKKKKQKQLQKNCLLIYGQLLVAQGDQTQAKQFLEKVDGLNGGELDIYKGWALGKIGDYENAADVFYNAFKENNITCAAQAIWLISQISDNIEYITEEIKDKDDFLKKCIYIGKQSYNNCQSVEKTYAGLYWIELTAFSEKYDPALESVLTQISEQIDTNSIEYLRAKARFSHSKADYRTAGMCWSRINYFHRTNPADQQRLRWWRSKYYELLSLSKLPGSAQQILHTIEVTKSSYPDQNEFWNKKLDALSERISSK